MKKVRFGLLGCGVIHAWHASVVQSLPEEAELVAVCDVVPERAQESAQKHHCDAYTDYGGMLARDDIDAIGIGTPSGLHSGQAIQALRAGKHVLVEKPIDVSLRRANELIRVARETGLVVTPVSQNRYGRGLVQLRRWLDEGRLGRLVYGEATIKWYRSQAYYDSGDWRGTWALDGGGALMNQGVHYADQLRWAMGAPKSVSARWATLGHRMGCEDVVTAAIEWESGALGTLTATTCAYPGFSTTLEVYGTEGSARIANNELVDAQFTDGTKVTSEDAAGNTGSADPKAISHYGHTCQFHDFIRAIREGGEPWITAEMGRGALELVLGVYRSARTGQSVSFPLPEELDGVADW